MSASAPNPVLPFGPTLITLAYGYGQLRGRSVTPVLPQWPAKDPLVTSSRWMDFRNVLGARTIVGLNAAAVGVTIVTSSWTGSVVTVRLQGGTDQTVARIELKALCDDGTAEPGVALMPVTAVLTLSEASEGSSGTTLSSNETALGYVPTLVFTQAIAAATWTIVHNTNRYPPVLVVDSANSVIEGDVSYDSLNQVTLTFSSAFAGVAYLT